MVMAEQGQHSYRFLDAEEDRQALIKDIHQTREELRKVVDLVPPDQWYVPRYHGWSLAAMLGHLELMDRLNLWLLSLAALSIQVPLPISAVKGFNEMVAMVYKNRRVEGSLHGLDKKEGRIADFILRLPVGKFSKHVFDPTSQKYYTIEQAIQEFFLYHWQENLTTMRMADDVHYEPPVEPPTGGDVV